MGYVFSNVAVDNFFREFMPFCVFLRKSGIFVVILPFWLLFGSFWHLITRHAYSVTGLARVQDQLPFCQFLTKSGIIGGILPFSNFLAVLSTFSKSLYTACLQRVQRYWSCQGAGSIG